MTLLTLSEKFYGPIVSVSLNSFQKFLSSVFSGIEADIKILNLTRRGWVQVEVSGLDTMISTNYFKKIIGIVPTIDTLQIASEIRGRIIDSGKVGYGLYIDIGISKPKAIDVLIPLYALRRQLIRGKKISVRKLIKAFCLYENLPLKIKLTKISYDEKKIEGELSEDQLSIFQSWVTAKQDRVIIIGTTFERIRRAIKRSNSNRDIIKVDQLGFLEYALLCKIGTEAPGMIKKLGPFLPKIPLYVFSIKKIEALIQ